MITKKTYIPGKPRNKKLTNVTSGAASVGKTEFNQIAGESHVHYNKKVLDQITEAMLESMANAISELIKVDDETELTDENVMSSLRVIAEILSNNEELKNIFLSKIEEDEAAELITFLKGIIVNGLSKLEDVELESLIAEKLARLKKGAIFGEEFITGMIGGRGAKLAEDENGKSVLEIDKITAREELIVPKITFNNIDVVSGDQAATFAFGTIKNVDTEDRTFELDLLEGEFGTLHQNDILRGVFHNLTGGNVENDFTDTNGFLNYSGFATAYFSPSQILVNLAGQMKVKYFIQPGTTVHPVNGMNFFGYGNFTDTDRQGMTYQNRLYTRRLKNQDTWDIVPTRNIAFQDGLLEGLTIGGMEMHGYGTYSENNYMTGANIQFTPSQLDELRGKSSYSVSLSSYERVVKLDEDGIHGMHEELNVVSGDLNVTSDGLNVITSVNNLSTRIQAFKGEDELLFAQSPEKGKYSVVISEHGCVAEVQGGVLSIEEITNLDECYVDLNVNCEGLAVFQKRFSVSIVRDGSDGDDGKDGKDGEDGRSPFIGPNGNWWVWDANGKRYVDSGDPAQGETGENGLSPRINAAGYWEVWNGSEWVDTGIKAEGADGKDGKYTELRYKYAFTKPATPAGINPSGWSLSNENNKIATTRTGDFIVDGEYRSSPTQANSSTKKDRLNFTTTKPNQILTLEVFVSSESKDFGVVTLLDTAYAAGGSYTWRKSGVVKETIEILVPTAGSHFIEIAYVKDSSGVGNDDKMRYRVLYPSTCWVTMAVIDPNTNTTTGWSEPVEFPTDTPDEEQIYLLSKSDIVADMPSSDPYTDEYIGDAPAYVSTKSYVRGNIVKYNSAYKINILACTGIFPTNSTYWEDVMWWTDDPGGISSEYPYEYECERSFTNVWGDYGKYRLFMRYPKDGEDGETPVVNTLIPSVTQIGKTMTGSYEPSSFTVYHRDSKGVAVIACIAVLGSNNGSTWTQIGVAENVSSKVINVASYPFKYYLIRTYTPTSLPAPEEVEYSTSYLLSVSINVLQDGEDGAAGARGAMPVYCGYYKSGTAYTYTNETRDIINYDFGGQPFTFQVKNHGASVTTPPTSSTGDANWEVADKYSFVAMDTALIDGANIAGFMYKDLRMISQLGTLDGAEIDIKNVPEARILDFEPHTYMNGATGEIVTNRITARGHIAEPFEEYQSLEELLNGRSLNWYVRYASILNGVVVNLSNERYNGSTLRVYNASSLAASFTLYTMKRMSDGTLSEGGKTIFLPSKMLFEAIGAPSPNSGYTRFIVKSPHTYNTSNHTYTIQDYG